MLQNHILSQATRSFSTYGYTQSVRSLTVLTVSHRGRKSMSKTPFMSKNSAVMSFFEDC